MSCCHNNQEQWFTWETEEPIGNDILEVKRRGTILACCKEGAVHRLGIALPEEGYFGVEDVKTGRAE